MKHYKQTMAKRFIYLLLLCIPLKVFAQSALEHLQNMHTVQRKETFYEIARKYGVSITELELANPDVNKEKLKKGTLLIIPKHKEEAEPTPATEEVIATPAPQIRLSYETLKVGILLPLQEKTPRAAKLLEFYQGFLMAVDSVKKEGKNIEVYTWHCGKTTDEMLNLLQTPKIAEMTVIFGPADNEQIGLLADFCRGHHIRHVLPFANTHTYEGFPQQYIATAGNYVTQREAVKKICGNAYDNRNYIHLKTNYTDNKGELFLQHVKTFLNEQGQSIRELNIEADTTAYESVMNLYRNNVIIPDNCDQRTLNILFAKLNLFTQIRPDYKISIIGYPEWQTYTSNQLREFYKYDTYIYTPYFYNPLDAKTAQFEAGFRKNFNTSMQVSFPRYGMLGFDLGYYFMHGLATLGDTFEVRQGELTYNPYQHYFQFNKYAENDGFTNHAVQLIHYTPQQTIEQIR